MFCWHCATGYCPFRPVPAGRSAACPHCHSVLSVGGTAVSKTLATLCYELITKFSTAVQCGSTLVRYTNSDTCVTGSAATGTRVSGVLCTEHGGVSCCPPIYVSVTGMLGPVAAHRYTSVSLECSAQLLPTDTCQCHWNARPSCCPPIHVSVTGMLGPAAACISAQNK